MQNRLVAAVSLALVPALPALATPEDFDFFIFELSVGVGGDLNDEPLDSQFDLDAATAPGPGSLELDISFGGRTLLSRIDYDISVESGPGSLSMLARFDALVDLSYLPEDVSGSVEAFSFLDAYEIFFTLDEPHWLDLSLGSATLFGENGTPDFGPVDAGSTLIPAGSYALSWFEGAGLLEVFGGPGIGDQLEQNSLEVAVGLTAVPAPGSAALLLAGVGLVGRRRR